MIACEEFYCSKEPPRCCRDAFGVLLKSYLERDGRVRCGDVMDDAELSYGSFVVEASGGVSSCFACDRQS